MRRSVLLLMLVALSMLVGCTTGKKAALTMPEAAAEMAPQDSLRAKFLLTIFDEKGKAQDMDAVLFSVPGKRYRMELTGPLGVGVASMLWTDSGWTITFPTEKLYMKGVGYMVGLLNDNSLPLVHIHQVASLFEGKLLPEKFDLLESAGESPVALEEGVQAFFGKESTGRSFAYGMKDSSVVWLSRNGRDGKRETLLFSDYKVFEGVRTPSLIVFKRDGKDYLKILIKKVTHGKPFSLGTWRLNVPRSFTPVGG